MRREGLSLSHREKERIQIVVIYPIFGHWCWCPDGFPATMGSQGGFLSSLGMNFHDFAGSTVVHSIGGWVAIAGAIMLGPRLGRKFKRDGGGPMPPHDLTIAVIGGLILWFGWFGFNPCSTLSLMDNAGVGHVLTNTATFVSAMAMFAALNAVGLLRVSRAGEIVGLDVDQHGISAYPEYVISGAGLAPDVAHSVGGATRSVEA